MFTEATDSSPPRDAQPAGSCGECGAPHAQDQRYCLHCGAPLAGAGTTVAFAPVAGMAPGHGGLAGTEGVPGVPPIAGAAQAPPASPPPHLLAGYAAGAPGQHQTMTSGNAVNSAPTVIAGVGVLLLAMGVGVLIGRTGSSAPTAATTPQVVTVTASTASSATEAGESTGSASKHGSSKHHGKSSGSSKEVGSSIEKPAPPAVLTKLKEAEKASNGSKYEQNSNKLPNVISTG